jgi:predicted double-glycine peptidase
MKKMLNWRKNHPAITSGTTLHFAPFEGLYVYFRYNQQETLMVVMNRNNETVQLNTGRMKEILHNKSIAQPIFSTEKLALSQPISIPAKTAMVFTIQ